MTNSEILIYQAPDGKIKIDVRLKNETVWLTQAHLCELFHKSKATISEHIKHIFEEGELTEESVVRNFRTTASDEKNYLNEDEIKLLGLLVEQYLAFAETMAQQRTPMYMKDWIQRLDAIIQLNGRELLTNAGKISHQLALDKSAKEYDKYKEFQHQIQQEESMKELEGDLKNLQLLSVGKKKRRDDE